jgi:hypothetical protein
MSSDGMCRMAKDRRCSDRPLATSQNSYGGVNSRLFFRVPHGVHWTSRVGDVQEHDSSADMVYQGD